jgi:hypothetical protein
MVGWVPLGLQRMAGEGFGGPVLGLGFVLAHRRRGFGLPIMLRRRSQNGIKILFEKGVYSLEGSLYMVYE